MTATTMSTGAAARYGTALRQVSYGRDSARARPNALTASVIITANLKRKRGVSAAVAIPGIGPSVAKKTAADRKSAVWGKRVSVSVDLGGRRIINQKKQEIQRQQ